MVHQGKTAVKAAREKATQDDKWSTYLVQTWCLLRSSSSLFFLAWSKVMPFTNP